MEKAWVTEIFDSIQGEGIYAGARQIFIRFSGCNLRRCSYCDSRLSWKRQRYCVVKLKAQSSKVKAQRSKLKNPITAVDIIKVLKKYLTFNFQRSTFNYHSVSLTGGEPLLQADFLKELIPDLKSMGFRIYLETNGTLPAALRGIIKNISYVAMDIKLPSATGRRDLWEKHRRFLHVSGRKAFVKVVITKKTRAPEIIRAASLVKGFGSSIPLVLQPAGCVADRLLEFQELAGRKVRDVRVIPQIHKILGVI